LNSIETCFNAVGKILENLPSSWVDLTTHRLDIYDEDQAKSQFLTQLQTLQLADDFSAKTLEELPTAYDYIRLGHQLSCILEWLLAQINQVHADQVITFSSKTMPILALLRKNTLAGQSTHLYYDTDSSPLIDEARLKQIYGYRVTSTKVSNAQQIPAHSDAMVVFVTQAAYKTPLKVNDNVDATVNIHPNYGSTIVIHHSPFENMVKDIQHVRRRESIAMTPPNALNVLQEIVSDKFAAPEICTTLNVNRINDCINENTGSTATPLVASSGLSIQYAILMGLVENALTLHPTKPIKIILPPNCYGGTNDQARRIADLIDNVSIIDLYVDSGKDLVSSLDIVLKEVAQNDGVPIVLAEIPTNPRVEVPDIVKLGEVLSVSRKTQNDDLAVDCVFMVDQTFCPNVKFLHQDSQLAKAKVISFSSGSKFPSGGRCIAGYCAANNAAKELLSLISAHLVLSDNNAVAHQLNTLAQHMPSMPERIKNAYNNTRVFVEHIHSVLPNAKINFVSQALADQGFTPSVFALDLPAVGQTSQAREESKRTLNKKLIDRMIEQYPLDCKYCVSYGQLKGSYWTIPATSTQGTTKETDKDYIVRVALSPDIDISKLSTLFSEFCVEEKLV
jgi:cystathionine beta-lyase/cystathionine gamma-synthase